MTYEESLLLRERVKLCLEEFEAEGLGLQLCVGPEGETVIFQGIPRPKPDKLPGPGLPLYI